MGEIYVLAVAPHRERLVQWKLEEKGFASYTPFARKFRWLAGRKVEVSQPIMPGYVFVWSDDIEDDFEQLRHATHVLGLLASVAGNALRVDPAKVAALMIAQTWGAFDDVTPRKFRVTLKQRVRIIGGVWQGREAIVVKVLDDHGTKAKVQVASAGAFGILTMASDSLQPILTAAATQ